MSERFGSRPTGSSAALTSLTAHPDNLTALDVEVLTDAQRLDLLSALERLKGAAAACQARAVVAFAASQRALDAEQGARPEKRGAGVAMQVGLAMRTSHAKARRFTGFAHVLGELPHTYDTLAAGETSEYRAYLVAKETIELTLEDRLATDRELAERPGGIGALSDREAETHTRAIAQRLDPASAVRRNSDAVKQRRVSLRAAPDGMCRLSAVLPLPDGVRVIATLEQAATRALLDPTEERSRGAVMADELVTRVTSTSTSTSTEQPADVTVNLLMTDATLFGADDQDAHEGLAQEPAHVVTDTGRAGDLPADTARGLVRDAARVFIRRLYRDPRTGDLVAMDTRARELTGLLRRFLVLRDQQCRTPWCDAPVRHLDHVTRWTDGGPTTAANGQGLCAACNHGKEHARLDQRAMADGSVTTTTPTRHSYRSHPPRPPGPPPRPKIDWSTLERWLRANTPA